MTPQPANTQAATTLTPEQEAEIAAIEGEHYKSLMKASARYNDLVADMMAKHDDHLAHYWQTVRNQAPAAVDDADAGTGKATEGQ